MMMTFLFGRVVYVVVWLFVIHVQRNDICCGFVVGSLCLNVVVHVFVCKQIHMFFCELFCRVLDYWSNLEFHYTPLLSINNNIMM